MNHADAAHTLVSLCRGFARRPTGLSFLRQFRRWRGLRRWGGLSRLVGLRRLRGFNLSYFHWRAGLLRGPRAFLSSLGMHAD